MDEAYHFINIFECNKVIIKEIKINKSIKLLIKMYINNIEKDIEILLLSHNNNYIINNYIKENNEIKKIKDEIKLFKNRNKKIKDNKLKKK